MQAYLRLHGRAPADYLLAKLDAHRVVIAGESHWNRDDARLIAELVPQLAGRQAVLAMEFFPAASQGDIDALLAAPEWSAPLANRIMRAGDWPYVEYRDILERAWQANRAGGARLAVAAIGPPEDWRALGIHYDTFMADRVRELLADERRRVLVYCGMHHAFTRYLQVERLRQGRASEFMERMGNILWRRYGQEVFLVALHKPDGCGTGESAFAELCAPLGGAIDCAALRNGGAPVGFDVLGSPVAEAKFEPRSYYAAGHPLLRLIDYADGWIWQRPVEEARLVQLIPLAEYAPDLAGDTEKRAEWQRDADDFANPRRRPSWTGLAGWRAACALE